MKEKIFIFIIGLLLGAVIATGSFFVYTKTMACNTNNNQQMSGGTPPEMPNGQSGQPPEMPNNENTQNSSTQNSNS